MKIYVAIREILSEGKYMPNIKAVSLALKKVKALSVRVNKVMASFEPFDRQTGRVIIIGLPPSGIVIMNCLRPQKTFYCTDSLFLTTITGHVAWCMT